MIKVSFVGDITCDRPFLQAAKRGSVYDFSGAFEHIMGNFHKCDYAVGNLETTFCGDKVEYNKGLHYNTPDSFLEEVKKCGFDLLTTANNHCFDGAMRGLQRTRDILLKNDFDVTGTYSEENENKYFIKCIGGVKVAFLSYTYSINMYPDIKIPNNLSAYINLLKPCKSRPLSSKIFDKICPYTLRRRIKILLRRPTISAYTDRLYPEMICEEYLDNIREQIKKAKSEADVVVFCLHIGGQFNEKPGDYSEYMMKFLKEQEVDVVIGHHPHTIQKTEVTEKGNIYAYSLGGFSLSPSAIYINHECKPEYSQLLNIYIDKDRKSIVKCTFSFVKILENQNAFINVVPAADLYKKLQGKEKEELLSDIKSLYQRITSTEHVTDFVSEEYVIFESKR